MIPSMTLQTKVDIDFSRARRRAFLRRLTARLRNNLASNQLLSFDEVRRALLADNQINLGIREVEVKKIAGSVGRYRDFDRSFLPARASVAARWKHIDRAFHRTEDLPPVSLYKIGDSYFVLDGNHRVSVARYHGTEWIDAEVVELRTQAPLSNTQGALRGLPPGERRHRRKLFDRSLSEAGYQRGKETRKMRTYYYYYWKVFRHTLSMAVLTGFAFYN